jgi:hypothetical protein
MSNQIIKTSPHISFQVTQLCESVAICEAIKGDQYQWGNATATEPAFITYLGCQKEEVAEYIKTFSTLYHVSECEVRPPKYLKGFEAEIKVRGLQRESNRQAFGLDHFLESEIEKHLGCNFDQYEYYRTGALPRW